jgi:beta-glucosidase
LALKAAHEALILLKNQNSLLPLDRAKYRRIAVIGPNAGEVHLGGYSNNPGRGVSVLQGIKSKVGAGGEVLFAEGCKITETPPDWDADKVVLGDAALNAKRIQEAVQVARKATWSCSYWRRTSRPRAKLGRNASGDRDNRPARQPDDLAKRSWKPGRPSSFCCSMTSSCQLRRRARSAISTDGTVEAGAAGLWTSCLATQIPAALPITVPRSVGQLPGYYYQKPSGADTSAPPPSRCSHSDGA